MRDRAARSRRAAAEAAVCGGLLLLVLAAALPPAASALTSHFAIDDGAAYATSRRLDIGDGGWSPFFTPGVVVWDGGSVIAGRGADSGHKFPALTLALVPRTCRSYVSETGSARVADMIAEGPLEVDARYRASADLDLCVVLVGGGDLRAGAAAADVYQGLREYCAARRAAGFRSSSSACCPAGSSRPSRPGGWRSTR